MNARMCMHVYAQRAVPIRLRTCTIDARARPADADASAESNIFLFFKSERENGHKSADSRSLIEGRNLFCAVRLRDPGKEARCLFPLRFSRVDLSIRENLAYYTRAKEIVSDADNAEVPFVIVNRANHVALVATNDSIIDFSHRFHIIRNLCIIIRTICATEKYEQYII